MSPNSTRMLGLFFRKLEIKFYVACKKGQAKYVAFENRLLVLLSNIGARFVSCLGVIFKGLEPNLA